MISLTYLSSATEQWSQAELDDLLRSARVHNEQVGITGMLLYSGGNFIQTLEGEHDQVDALFSVIDADPRHFGVFIVRRDEIDQRQFAAWSMGFKRIALSEAEEAAGFTDYLESGRIEGEEPQRSAVATFHRVFRRNVT